jgi:5-deoxy-glucuronate isomerase
MGLSTYHLRAGDAAKPPFSLLVTPQAAGWTYCGLAILELAAGESVALSTGESEYLVLSLAGAVDVACDGTTLSVAGRESVFSAPSDFVYVPRDATATLSSEAGGRFALPSAVCDRRLPFRHGSAEDVPVELRGAGAASRQVNNFCTPAAFDADRLIACEVLTPGGNWSSYPPHKHDEGRAGETELEEIYYFEIADRPAGLGVAYQRVYGHERADVDVLAEVRTGDAVLIPHGWHGPSMAAPGYDLYYLNVMAGPGEARAWMVSDDPAHAWVRQTWAEQPIDPRLPFGAAATQGAAR